MTYQVIARKYRPRTFDEIIGQEPIVRTLKNAIQQNLVAHAYIFSGMRGVGKTTTARILAKALNCKDGPTTTPCGACPACTEISLGTAVDVLEIDAASNRGIDEIRELRDTVRYLPARDRYRVFIIDEVHMLTPEAFNALLKTLEEPPERVLFILATTEPHRIPSTIQSRCQSFHFRSISFAEILDVLQRVATEEGAKVEPEGLAVMTRAAEGSLRDALSVLDQAIAYCGKDIRAEQVRELLGVVSDEILNELMAAVVGQSSERMLRLVDLLVRDGHNLQYFCGEALRHIRNLLVVRIGGAAAELAEAAGRERKHLEAAAAQFSEEDLLRFFHILLQTERELRWSPQPRLHLELGLLKLVQAERLVPLEELLAELSGGATPSRPADSNRPATRSNPAPAPRAAAVTQSVPPRPEPAATPRAGGASLAVETVEKIKSAVFAKSKFLGSFVEGAAQWERGGEGLTLWFGSDSRTLIDMLGRGQQAQLEAIVSEALGEPVKVSAKVGAPTTPSAAPPPLRSSDVAPVENPVVQALLDRFGGSVRRGSQVPAPRKRED
ncbi:MAG: DNA polymerase III subunit gamma/tau [Candidatus Acidiferrales bacterium]